MKKRFTNKSGSMLVQVLVAFGIMGILVLVLTSVFQQMNRQQSFHQQKADSISSQSLITAQFISTVENCTLTLKDKPFDVAAPPAEIPLSEIIVGPAASATALVKTTASAVPGGSVANSILLTNIVPDAVPGEYRGNIVIDFKNTVMATKKMDFPVFFKASAATNTITGCRVPSAPSNIVVLNLGEVQAYPAGSCPAGWIVSPALTARRLDCGSGNTWVGVSIPNIDGALSYTRSVEFGAPKTGGAGHGWLYYVKGLSQRFYIDPASLDPSLPHTIGLNFFIGERTSFAPNAGAFATFLAATPATVHPCISLIETTMMIECLK